MQCMDTGTFRALGLDSRDNAASSEDPALLLQETVADLTELQLQVEHARHHALDKKVSNYPTIDKLLDGTALQLESWIEKVLKASVLSDHKEEAYESLRTEVLEEEL